MILWARRGREGGSSERGFVLVTVVVLTFFLFALVTSYLLIIVVERSAIFSSKNDLKAESIAEAGVEDALWMYNYGDPNFASNGWSSGSVASKSESNFSDSSGTPIGAYEVTIQNFKADGTCDDDPDPSSNTCPFVDSKGTYAAPGGKNIWVIVKARLKPRPAFPAAVTTKEQITFTGNGLTDSYTSEGNHYYGEDLGGGALNIFSNAHVRTNMKDANKAINLDAANGNPAIRGNAFTGFGSTISDSYKVSGETGETPEKVIKDNKIPGDIIWQSFSMDMPLNNPIVPTDFVLPGNYKYNRIQLNGGDLIRIGDPNGADWTQVRLWIDGDVSIGGTATLSVSPKTILIVYVEGGVNAAGNGITNGSGDPSESQFPLRVQIYGMKNCDSVGISGGAQFVGVVKAPYADITLGGTSDQKFYGAFVGFSFSAKGGGGVHFDERLFDLLSEPGAFELDWIRRVAKGFDGA